MGDHADDAIFGGLIESWGFRRRTYPRPRKKTNAEIFAGYAGEPSKFKVGDRVVHSASGTRGTVTATRGSQVSWRPDSRLKPGSVWIDSDGLRYDI